MAKFDIKKAFLDHVEKGVFGIITLLVLMGLASTKWSRYAGTPEEITSKVTQGQNTLKNNTWPDEEREKYLPTEERKPSTIVHREVFRDINPAPYDFSTSLVTSATGSDEPIREPELNRPEDTIASAARVFLEILPPEDEADESEEGEDALAMVDGAAVTDEDEDIPDEFRIRKNTAGAGAMGGDGYGEGGSYSDYLDEGSLYMSEPGGPGAPGGPGGLSEPGMEGEYEDGYMEGDGYMAAGGMGGGSLATRNGQGYHFASIRAVFPLRDQIRKYAEATHTSYHIAASRFLIIDFELERQSFDKVSGEWNEWEPVEMNVAMDVLNNSAGFEGDVVNSMVTDSVITMPLPRRISGEWFRQATHPRLESFELTKAQMDFEYEMTSKMLRSLAEQKKEMSEREVQRGGFTAVSFDSRQIQGDLMGSDSYYDMESQMGGSGMMGGGMGPGSGRTNRGGRNANPKDPTEKLVSMLAEDSENPKEQEKAIREWITQRASVEGELLLFRYFDFSVEPGNTYRYRVRFELNNPNVGRRIADAGGLQHVVEGKTRKTEWSDVTKPVSVAKDAQYFLAEVKQSRNSKITYPNARLEMFQWDTTHGTTMNDKFEVRLGQQVGDTVKTLVIDPAQQVYEEQEYTFASKHYLVDVVEDLKIDEEFHGGDGVPAQFQLKMMRGVRDSLALKGLALVHGDDGKLVSYDGVSNTKTLERLRGYEEKEAKQFEALKKIMDAKNAPAELGEYGEMEDGYMEGMGYMGGAEDRSSSALRKGGRSSRSRSSRGRGRGGAGGGYMSGPGAP